MQGTAFGGVDVSIPEEIMREVNRLPGERQQRVLDFVHRLRQREDAEISALMDKMIGEDEEALRALAK